MKKRVMHKISAIFGASLFFFLYILPHLSYAQQITLMSYNCENAFDTIHDVGKNDFEYLPDGNRHWSRGKLFYKLNGIGKTIMAVEESRPVDIVCLNEVENDSVLTWLTCKTPLAAVGYKYVMTNSADVRGVDVALLYSPFTFHVINHYSIRAKTTTPTRDVLYVSGVTLSHDTLDIFAVHLPSKLNGLIGEENRCVVARTICSSIDSIYNIRKNANIVVMGDFNDGPKSKVIKNEFSHLTDLMAHEKQGSYKYKGVWQCIDHILVNEKLLPRVSSSGVMANPMLLEEDTKYGGVKPYRTYVGFKYNGGYSDHLPVFARFTF